MIGHDKVGSGALGVIVLNDWMCDTSTWDGARVYLDQERFTWAFADLRGYGRSIDVRGAFTVAEAAADVVNLADALGWRRFAIVGHSMSTLVALHLAQHLPDRVDRAVLLTPPPPSGFGADDATLAAMEAIARGDDAKRIRSLQTMWGDRLSGALDPVQGGAVARRRRSGGGGRVCHDVRSKRRAGSDSHRLRPLARRHGGARCRDHAAGSRDEVSDAAVRAARRRPARRLRPLSHAGVSAAPGLDRRALSGRSCQGADRLSLCRKVVTTSGRRNSAARSRCPERARRLRPERKNRPSSPRSHTHRSCP